MQEYIEFFQQNMILSLVWVGLLVAFIMNIVKSATAAYKEINVNQLTHLMNRENGVVVDIRTKDEFKKVISPTHFTFYRQTSKQVTWVALKTINQTQSLLYARRAKPLKKARTF